MAQETKVEETRCSLQTFERNRYFYGKPMTVSDFEAEQRYLIGKHRYINRLVHGAGVLCGLQVTLPESFSAERPTVELAEGAALDCCGNLIVVSRSGTAEIKGDFDPEGLNYLYIKYNECSKQPVMLAANGSSCEEVCCYNRIQETFEIVASRTAPGGSEAAPAIGATASNAVTASAGTTDAESVCRGLTEKYYQEHLRTCPGCDDPLVFLAVLDSGKGALDETETTKYRSVVYNNTMLHELLCDHVTDYDNPHHTSAEQVRALQSVNGVGNSPTRSFVANIDLRSNDNTIGITPNKNAAKIELILASDAVKLSHLNREVFENLLQSSKTITVEPNVGGRKITLRTTPAASVTSVGGNRVVGTSSSYAPEDHAHDLSEGLVELKHLGEEVYAKLIQGDGIIKVEPDAAAQTIKISSEMAPADDLKVVSSVVGTKQVGSSKWYAREDHAHDLHINGRSPNESGQFLLTPGANVTIANGNGDNELVISAEGGSQTVIASGIFVFENVRPQEVRLSTLIAHGLESRLVAVILGEEETDNLRNAEGLRLNPVNAIARFGDITAFADDAPFLMAEVDFAQKTIQISLKDRRQGNQNSNTTVKLTDGGEVEFIANRTFDQPGETDPSGFKDPSGIIAPTRAINPSGIGDDIIVEPEARTYRVRWWAIPA
ncbi:MAG: hypothetical protein QOH49_1481 [Acidobacteriota bacterium]|jgi:hypothetical protein|nr:hypothetical protein [Acidobacteriota bacterium]